MLIGAKLGSPVNNESPITYTMQEVEIAEKYKLLIIAFLLEEDEYKKERDKISSDQQFEREHDKLLENFRKKVQEKQDGGKRIVGFFNYDKQFKLSDDYADAVWATIDYLIETGATGWVDGKLYDELQARISFEPAVGKNPFFRRFAERLSTFDKLSRRTQIQAELKAGIAEFFWERYMPRIDEKDIRYIFFDSGSSIAYASRKFIEYFKEEEWVNEHKLYNKLKIRTNNLLTYMDFLLVDIPWHPMDIRLHPYDPFSIDYGATYGHLKSTRKLNPPTVPNDRRELNNEAAKAVQKLISAFERNFSKTGIILIAASGVDINPKSSFQGPHVGSYYNMLLKRCLFSLPCPKVLFLDETKWEFDFILNNCHSVCDSKFTWKQLKNETPLAIAIAATTKLKRDNLTKSLAENGFSHQECGEVKPGLGGPWSIIAGNAYFEKYFT